nr:unnamed protein product [Callosobruchus analis]
MRPLNIIICLSLPLTWHQYLPCATLSFTFWIKMTTFHSSFNPVTSAALVSLHQSTLSFSPILVNRWLSRHSMQTLKSMLCWSTTS